MRLGDLRKFVSRRLFLPKIKVAKLQYSVSDIYKALKQKKQISIFCKDYLRCDTRSFKKWCCNPRYFDYVNERFGRFAADYFIKTPKKRKASGRPIQKDNLAASPAIRAMVQNVMASEGKFWGAGNGD